MITTENDHGNNCFDVYNLISGVFAPQKVPLIKLYEIKGEVNMNCLKNLTPPWKLAKVKWMSSLKNTCGSGDESRDQCSRSLTFSGFCVVLSGSINEHAKSKNREQVDEHGRIGSWFLCHCILRKATTARHSLSTSALGIAGTGYLPSPVVTANAGSDTTVFPKAWLFFQGTANFGTATFDDPVRFGTPAKSWPFFAKLLVSDNLFVISLASLGISALYTLRFWKYTFCSPTNHRFICKGCSDQQCQHS